MKIISSIIFTLGAGAALMAGNVSPAPGTAEKKEVAPVVVQQQPLATAQPTLNPNSAIKVITPQKDLESAIRNSDQGDILLQGHDGWYRIEGKTLKQGTKMYVLGGQASMVTSFPKEADNSSVR